MNAPEPPRHDAPTSSTRRIAPPADLSAEVLDRVLAQRRARHGRARRLLGGAAAVLLHASIVGAMVLGPRLFAKPPEVKEFVPVQLVPAPRRGVVNPALPPPQPTAKPAPSKAPPQPEPSAAPAPTEPPPVLDTPRAKTLPPEKSSRRPPPEAAATPLPAAPARPPGPAGVTGGNPDSPFTATVGGVDNPNFTYGYYLDRMLLLIRSQWVRPPLGSGVEATVHFRILANGAVESVELATSSGYNSFDLAALRAVQAAAPLPPLPRSYREGELGVNLIFR